MITAELVKQLREKTGAGKLDYLKMVKGEDDSTYLKLRNRYNVLMNVPVVEESVSTIKYLDTQKVSDFEKTLGTKIEVKKSKSGKMYGVFVLGKEKHTATISKNAWLPDLKNLHISLCENQKKERFYFVHRPLGKKAKKALQAPATPLSLDDLLAKLCETNFDLCVL